MRNENEGKKLFVLCLHVFHPLFRYLMWAIQRITEAKWNREIKCFSDAFRFTHIALTYDVRTYTTYILEYIYTYIQQKFFRIEKTNISYNTRYQSHLFMYIYYSCVPIFTMRYIQLKVFLLSILFYFNLPKTDASKI